MMKSRFDGSAMTHPAPARPPQDAGEREPLPSEAMRQEASQLWAKADEWNRHAAILETQAETLQAQATTARNTADDLEDQGTRLNQAAKEAEAHKDDPAWCEAYAARTDPRQGRML